MKQVIEIYVGIWVIMILFLLATAFTTINLNVTQARKIYSDIRSEVQASNGYIVDNTNRFYYSSRDDSVSGSKLENDGYQYEYSVIRQSLVDSGISVEDETYIYNNLYKISLKYEYSIPLFGRQVYPITGFAY